MIRRLESLGFRLVGLEPGLADPGTGELIEADGLFVRATESPSASSIGRVPGE